jgi:predicted aspartyl protease
MIVRDFEVYSPRRDDYVVIEAIIDTGASVCVVAQHVAEELGIVVRFSRAKNALALLHRILLLNE